MTDNRTTELLCKLLDERGVEYLTNDDERAYDEPARTTWDFVLCGYDMTVTATEFVDVEGKTYLEMDFHHAFTPKQAIAATLGGGKLTAEQVRDAIERHITFYEGGDYDEKAIADELNAALGGGECEMKPIPFMGWQCSKCGRVSMVFGSGDKDREMPRFCPSCGKAVKR